MDREMYDLTTETHMCGKLGRLQTLQLYPVIAGDSLEIALDGIIRLAPLRKEIVSESIVDIMAFYVPHRHVYGQAWINYLMAGDDETTTLTSQATTLGARDLSYLTLHESPASIPLWVNQGYNRIWDRYFRVPSFDPDTNFDFMPTGTTQADRDWRKYGRLCARLPHPTNAGIRVSGATLQPHRDLTSSDFQVSTAGSVLDIRALETVKGVYRSEIERTWFAERYTDVLDIWNSSVSIDADQRPELLQRSTFTMSGTDIDGTDDATHGTYVGKTVAEIQFNMPRKHFAEHGAVWVMALVRFPLIHANESHPLAKEPNPPGRTLLMDPNVSANMPPLTATPQSWLTTTGGGYTDANIQEPWGNWYRLHNNNVHWHFKDLPGYPFVKASFDDPNEAYYHQVGDYDDVFQTSQLGHWQIHARVGCNAYRYVPPAVSSIFSGS